MKIAIIRHKKVAIVAIVVLVLLVTGGIVYATTRSTSLFISYAKQATFPLYEPTTLPKGYEISESSISLTNEVILFTAINTRGDTLIFTQNPVPKDFDFESFYKTRFVGIQDAQSIFGRGKVGIMDNVMTGSLVTNSTWILVKSHEDFPASDMKKIIESLSLIE